MFGELAGRLSRILEGLSSSEINEKSANDASEAIKMAILDADACSTAAEAIAQDVKQALIGTKKINNISTKDIAFKAARDSIMKRLGSNLRTSDSFPNKAKPVKILLIGLQGAGKTTTATKIAFRLQNQGFKNITALSADTRRPAAAEQLKIGMEGIGASFINCSGISSQDIARKANDLKDSDVIILDTAGRLSCDQELMEELKQIETIFKPTETVLVIDAMGGQEAAKKAKSFTEQIDITGAIVTRVEGDAKGGCVLSLLTETGANILFSGVGEKPNDLEIFDPKRAADRMLDMGDIIAVVEKAQQVADDIQQEKLIKNLSRGIFSFEDMKKYCSLMKKMGGLSSIMSIMPGMAKIRETLNEGQMENEMSRFVAIIDSMTPRERKFAALMNIPSRRKRVIKGSGSTVLQMNSLIKKREQIEKLMKKFGKLNTNMPSGANLGNIQELINSSQSLESSIKDLMGENFAQKIGDMFNMPKK